MTTRRPLVIISGAFSELPQGDSVAGVSTSLVSNPSGLYLDGADLGIDGSAIASGNAAIALGVTALASGNAALVVGGDALAAGTAALASGNAALSDLGSKVSKAGDVVSGTLVVDSQSYGTITTFVGSGVINLDFSAANNHEVTLEGNSTLGAPVSPSGGQSGAVVIRQDGTGSRTLSYSGGWSFAGGTAPTLTTTASGVDLLIYYVGSPTEITASTILDVQGA
jgi:hypothetical protein